MPHGSSTRRHTGADPSIGFGSNPHPPGKGKWHPSLKTIASTASGSSLLPPLNPKRRLSPSSPSRQSTPLHAFSSSFTRIGHGGGAPGLRRDLRCGRHPPRHRYATNLTTNRLIPGASPSQLSVPLAPFQRATRDILNEFLAAYGKVPDPEKEEKRLGEMYKKSTTGIIADYGLPLTVEEYSDAIHPLYLKRWQKAKPLPGVKRLVKHLHKHGVPLALASNSIRRNVNHKLEKLEERIVLKIGETVFLLFLVEIRSLMENLPLTCRFLEAAKGLGVNPSSCLVIEDSLVGVQGAKASGAKVVAVPSLQSQRQHYSIADTVLYSLLDFYPELWGLPSFEDRMQGGLLIEPLFSNAQIGDKILNNLHMHIDVLDFTGAIKAEPVKLLVIGYIRKLESTDNILEDLSITDEDRSIARNALELPAFSKYKNDLHFA
ncbi:hypothetical protein EJB05_16927, partial [Eragrostis curvula]